MSVKFGLWTFH